MQVLHHEAIASIESELQVEEDEVDSSLNLEALAAPSKSDMSL